MMLPYWNPHAAHLPGCSCPPCVKQRALIAAGEADAAELVRQERARRQAARIQADRDREPGWEHARVPQEGCTCWKCRMRKTEMVLEQPQQIQAGSITSGTITVDIPGSAGFRDPAAREGTSVPAEQPPDPAGEVEAALRDFDAWYAAGRGALPEPEPLPAGTCRTCRLSPAVANGQCFWCHLAEQNPVPEAAAAGRLGPMVLITTGVLALAGCLVVVMVLVWMLHGVTG